MFEMPGLSGNGNPKEDLDRVRRWLMRFVPQLEQELSNLGTDNFTSAYNERLEGLVERTGAEAQKTSAEALAEHILDNENPHKVTLEQLGYTEPQAVWTETEHGWAVTLGGIMLEAMYAAVSVTGEAAGSLYKATVEPGDWDVPFGSLSTTKVDWIAEAGWIGGRHSQTESSAGAFEIYDTAADMAGTAVIIGIGGVTDGGAKETDIIAG
jgi:hypothetical protein